MVGYWGFDNMIFVYDNNFVIVDGNIDICFIDDIFVKFKSFGWYVFEVEDGFNDFVVIVDVFE